MFASLRNRLKRLEGRVDSPPGAVSVWDVLVGLASPEKVPPEVLAQLDATLTKNGHDAVEERLAAALRLTCGFRELPPWSPGDEPPVNLLEGKPSSNGDGH